MKYLIKIPALVLVLGLFMASHASALVITPTSSYFLTSGSETGQAAINAAISSFLGDSEELYKANVGQGTSGWISVEEKSLADSFTTEFTGGDPNGAEVTYDGGADSIDLTHLLVKDGNNNPAWYLFDISAWDFINDTLILSGFWEDTADVKWTGGISHISLYGGSGSTEVPEPASLALLALGLLGLRLKRARG